MIIKLYLSSRFRLLALLAAFFAGVGVTIFSWWIGLVLLVVAAALDFLSFFLARKTEVSETVSDLFSLLGQR